MSLVPSQEAVANYQFQQRRIDALQAELAQVRTERDRYHRAWTGLYAYLQEEGQLLVKAWLNEAYWQRKAERYQVLWRLRHDQVKALQADDSEPPHIQPSAVYTVPVRFVYRGRRSPHIVDTDCE